MDAVLRFDRNRESENGHSRRSLCPCLPTVSPHGAKCDPNWHLSPRYRCPRQYRRPDVIAAERTLAASSARIGVAVSEFYPKISLGGLLGTATTAAGGLFTGNATQANGALGLRWRLFDFGRVDAEIKAAKGRNTEALAAYCLTVLRASQDVEDAFSTLVQQEARAATLAHVSDLFSSKMLQD